ncbi:MAG: hydroxymethylglutaryl-CoA lyase [Bacteroidetes bacterium]|nr:MAG: hydroxymethylglutaryl-CoA lyase [Bacteroidota bacterium]
MHLVECPRDALQGWPFPISTSDKIAYYRTLLDVGFDTLDLGSFVSPKAVPSMANTDKVLNVLEDEGLLTKDGTRALVIVANERGAKKASNFESVNDIGFPLSLSESFQQRNTGASIEEAFIRLEKIQNTCVNHSKRLVVYLSMGFGNPYGEAWHPEMLTDFSHRLNSDLDVKVIALSDTVGNADEKTVEKSFSVLTKELPNIEFGAHMHLHVTAGLGKIEAALRGGCLRFDGAMRGIGGCPMAQDDLVGNAPTERMVELFTQNGLWNVANDRAWSQAQSMAASIFADH